MTPAAGSAPECPSGAEVSVGSGCTAHPSAVSAWVTMRRPSACDAQGWWLSHTTPVTFAQHAHPTGMRTPLAVVYAFAVYATHPRRRPVRDVHTGAGSYRPAFCWP